MALSNLTILQVLPELKVGGAEIEALLIAEAIERAGGKALIASQRSDHDFKHHHILPLRTKSPWQIWKNIELLKSLMVRENVSLVHARSRGPAWSAFFAAKALKIPFVTTYHAAYGTSFPFKKAYNSVMARGDRVIAISKFIEDHILAQYEKAPWFCPQNIRMIDRGIDCALFNPQAVEQERLDRLIKIWGIDPKRPLILLPGRVSRTKGQAVFINALALLRNKEAIAVFVGCTEGHERYQKTLQQQAVALGVGDRIFWCPPCTDMPAAYKLSHVVAFPSQKPEGFGRIAAEAQAMGVPIVLSNHGAPPHIIEEGVTGWTHPPQDAQILADHLDRLLNLPASAREDLATCARKRAFEHYSIERMQDETMAVYEAVISSSF